MSIPYFLYCLAILVAGGAGLGVYAYNRLVSLRQRQLAAFSQIDVQLKRRHDLIPNLVAAVKGYMRHERDTLEAILAARLRAYTALQNAVSPSDGETAQRVSGAEQEVSHVLSSLLAVLEKYPDLKASENTSELMEELRTTENRIAFARQYYNDTVAKYNSYRESFPVNIIAAGLGFSHAYLLEFEGSAFRLPPGVAFP